MPKTSVKIISVGKGFKNKQIAFATVLADLHLNRLSKATEKEIQEKISELSKRPGSTGRLAGSFFAEKISAIEYGVGKVSFLNEKAPYWRHVNYGSLVIGAKWQHMLPFGEFQPGDPIPNPGSFGQGRWNTKEGSFTFIPKNPIPPMNYIEKTLQSILTNVENIIKD